MATTNPSTIENGMIQQPVQRERILYMGALVTILVPAQATGGKFSMTEHVVPPAGGPPPHTHTVTEVFYILDGTFDVWLDDLATPARASAGASIVVPPGVPHTTRNVGERAGRLLSLYAPGGDEGFFREIGTPVAELASLPNMDLPPDLSGLDLGRVRTLAERYGMRLVPSQARSTDEA